MTADRKELIELYKATLEELRHHGTINTQAFIGLAIMIPVFLTAISFLLGSDSPICSGIIHVKRGILALACLLAIFFAMATWRMNTRFDACNKVLKNIEDELKVDQRTSGTSQFEGLLIRSELNEIWVEKRLTKEIPIKIGGKTWLISWIYIVYILVAVVALVGLGFLLFEWIAVKG
jgi:hypothetical protein